MTSNALGYAGTHERTNGKKTWDKRRSDSKKVDFALSASTTSQSVGSGVTIAQGQFPSRSTNIRVRPPTKTYQLFWQPDSSSAVPFVHERVCSPPGSQHSSAYKIWSTIFLRVRVIDCITTARVRLRRKHTRTLVPFENPSNRNMAGLTVGFSALARPSLRTGISEVFEGCRINGIAVFPLRKRSQAVATYPITLKRQRPNQPKGLVTPRIQSYSLQTPTYACRLHGSPVIIVATTISRHVLSMYGSKMLRTCSRRFLGHFSRRVCRERRVFCTKYYGERDLVFKLPKQAHLMRLPKLFDV